jgi:N-acetylmuramoyl-L-alanine amidase
MLKLAWSIGHDDSHSGAYSKILEAREHDLAREVVERGIAIIKGMELDIDVLNPSTLIVLPQTRSAGKILREKIHLINEWGAHLAIESHFNSSVFRKASGCETLYFSLPGVNRFSPKGKTLAQFIQTNTLYSLQKVEGRIVKDRGAKGMASLIRIYNGKETIPRYAFLTQTHMPAVITEPLFLSSEEDMKYLGSDRGKEITRLAMGVVVGVIKWAKLYGIDLRPKNASA